MSQPTVVLDPTAGTTPSDRTRSPRLTSLVGVTVGLLDISKPRGDVFLDRVSERLGEQGAPVLRYAPPPFTTPAPVALRPEIATQCAAVIEALAD